MVGGDRRADRNDGGGAVATAVADRNAVRSVTPVKWCAVNINEVLAGGMRLEAGVYDVDARNARDCVTGGRHGWRPLTGANGFAHAAVGGRFKRIWVESDGIPIFQPSAVPELDPEPDGYLSPKTQTDLDALRAHAGQVLVTCSGTVGKVAFVSKTLDGQVFSHDLLRITCHEPTDAGYVYAFLKSRAGQLLLCGSQYGAVITHIEPEHLASIPVPDAPEDVKRRIHEAVAKSYALRDESNDLLHKAAALLREALELPPIAEMGGRSSPTAAARGDTRPPVSADATERVPPLCFSVTLADLRGRLDASYHVPVVREIAAHLRAHAAEVATVGDKRVSKAVILPGRFKRVYVEEGYGKVFLGGKQLGELDPSNKKFLSVLHHEKRIADELTLRENMTIVTCSGTIGRVALVGRHWDGWTASQHIMRIVPLSPDIAGYLYVWLSSEWAKPLILRNSYGAVIDEISDEQLAAVPVPLLANAVCQSEINGLALRASALRSESCDMEQSALRMMEAVAP